jgi:hypothetical protein
MLSGVNAGGASSRGGARAPPRAGQTAAAPEPHWARARDSAEGQPPGPCGPSYRSCSTLM